MHCFGNLQMIVLFFSDSDNTNLPSKRTTKVFVSLSIHIIYQHSLYIVPQLWYRYRINIFMFIGSMYQLFYVYWYTIPCESYITTINLYVCRVE